MSNAIVATRHDTTREELPDSLYATNLCLPPNSQTGASPIWPASDPIKVQCVGNSVGTSGRAAEYQPGLGGVWPECGESSPEMGGSGVEFSSCEIKRDHWNEWREIGSSVSHNANIPARPQVRPL